MNLTNENPMESSEISVSHCSDSTVSNNSMVEPYIFQLLKVSHQNLGE